MVEWTDYGLARIGYRGGCGERWRRVEVDVKVVGRRSGCWRNRGRD